MKVVLFCGGLGTRLREHSNTVPKPLVNIGLRPIIWHLMRYYAHYGHKDFILCLGYRGDLIRDYFLNYNEALSNDFTLSEGGRRIELHSSDIDDWRITFVDTGLNTNIGQRLLKVRRFLEGEEIFLANYSDGLSDLPLDRQIADLRRRHGALASLVTVRSAQTFHAVRYGPDGVVGDIGPLRDHGTFINGGFFVFRSAIFDYFRAAEDDLVEHVFERLIDEKRLSAFPWNGFWQCMDTFKDKMSFDTIEASGDCPWMVWRDAEGKVARPASEIAATRAGSATDVDSPRVSVPDPDVEAPRAKVAAMRLARAPAG